MTEEREQERKRKSVKKASKYWNENMEGIFNEKYIEKRNLQRSGIQLLQAI